MSWHDYNESLVERGKIIFDLGFADTWKRELKSMNKGTRSEDHLTFPYPLTIGAICNFTFRSSFKQLIAYFLFQVKE